MGEHFSTLTEILDAAFCLYYYFLYPDLSVMASAIRCSPVSLFPAVTYHQLDITDYGKQKPATSMLAFLSNGTASWLLLSLYASSLGLVH